MSASLPDDVRVALAAGHKIEAIRLLRQQMGLGLAEAKAAVESGHLPPHSDAAADLSGAVPTTWPNLHPQGLPANAAAALAAGQKVKAILIVCAERGIGLKEAKALVDAAQHRVATRPDARSPSGLAPGEMPPSRFSSLALLAAIIVLMVLIWLALNTD